ncbi:MAG: hypothetical protein V1721_07560 [Pseudomonadota bacterium]
MTPAALIQRMAADGLHIAVTPTREIKVTGAQAAITRWLPSLQLRKLEIVSALSWAPPDIQDFINDVDERAAFLKVCAPDVYKTPEEATAAAYLEARNRWMKGKDELVR